MLHSPRSDQVQPQRQRNRAGRIWEGNEMTRYSHISTECTVPPLMDWGKGVSIPPSMLSPEEATRVTMPKGPKGSPNLCGIYHARTGGRIQGFGEGHETSYSKVARLRARIEQPCPDAGPICLVFGLLVLCCPVLCCPVRPTSGPEGLEGLRGR